jgi:hypothetical protein
MSAMYSSEQRPPTLFPPPQTIPPMPIKRALPPPPPLRSLPTPQHLFYQPQSTVSNTQTPEQEREQLMKTYQLMRNDENNENNETSPPPIPSRSQRLTSRSQQNSLPSQRNSLPSQQNSLPSQRNSLPSQQNSLPSPLPVASNVVASLTPEQIQKNIQGIELATNTHNLKNAPVIINTCAEGIVNVFNLLNTIKTQKSNFSKNALHEAKYEHMNIHSPNTWNFYQIYRFIQDGISEIALQLLTKMVAYNNKNDETEAKVSGAISEVAGQCKLMTSSLVPFLDALETKNVQEVKPLFRFFDLKNRRKSTGGGDLLMF